MQQIGLYDVVRLQDGRSAQIVELLDRDHFLADVQTEDGFDTILVTRSQIEDGRESAPMANDQQISQK